MHRLQYAELLEDDQSETRERERLALDRSITLMERADACAGEPLARNSAIYFTGKLWTILVEDLANSDNGLPRELRAQIISIGIWVLRELESIRGDGTRGFKDVIDVSRAIRDGIL